jgi:UDP-glucuronate 4-epimerase
MLPAPGPAGVSPSDTVRRMAAPRFLVTGALGCVGAWVARELVARDLALVAFDIGDDPGRLRLVLAPDELECVTRMTGDISDLVALERAIDEHGITNVIHLAALQVPFCRADPPLGARVNVVGTVNVLEALKRRRERMAPLVYASSIAAYDAADAGAGAAATTEGHPSTIYGVYKRANEGSAAVYWEEDDVASVGLRPHTVFGPGRDQGLTSEPTLAMLAAAAGRPYRIGYGGRSQLQYAPDVARAFVAASLSGATGASVHNLPGDAVHMAEVVGAIERAVPDAAGTITFDDAPLPFPAAGDASSLAAVAGPLPQTPFPDAVADAIERFRRLLADGLVA